jgi:CheY-like chemotaxis protein
MKKRKLSGKIILVDDERFEKELLDMALKDLDIHVDLQYFHNAEDALHYLKHTKDNIFLIISDLNMPKMNGMAFKKAIEMDNHLKRRAIPFVFSSSSATKEQLEEAYDYRLQGYFLKPHDVKSMAKQIELIINYWIESVHPNSELLGKQDSVYSI